MPLNNRRTTGWQWKCLFFLLVLPGLTLAQPRGEAATKMQREQPVVQEKKVPEKKLEIEVTKGPFATITLKANDVRLSEIVTVLARKLDIPITLSVELQARRVTAEWIGYSLEQTIRLLAPQSILDFVVSGDATVPPRYLALHLRDFNEALPAPNHLLTANLSGAEGEFAGEEESGTSSENTATPAQDAPLRVRSEHGRLSVRARQQPLLAVLTALATKLNVICEIQGNAEEKVDIDFSDYTLPAAVHALSPRVQFYLRTNLQTNETTLWRMALIAVPTR